MVPETGQMFGPYEILGRIGGGGMGMVFRAWDERLHRDVAIKLLYDDYRMPGLRERFLQEARAASKLSHPNICTIYDIGEKDGDPYLVMEFLEGETLKEKVAHGALSAADIVAHAQDVADALAAAHVKGIVHRDIKPANIFLVRQPAGGTQAKVLDFGLAKIGLREDGGWLSRSLDLNLAGATVGTLAYMSPEQACGQELDARSDLFSLGIVMYEMATRRIPFHGTTSALIYTPLLESDPDPVRKWNDSIPRELERLILRLLAKERRDRFQSAKELREALEKIEDDLEKGSWLFGKRSSTPVPLVPATEPVARKRAPRRVVGPIERGTQVPATERGSSEDNLLIRPRRIPGLEETLERNKKTPSGADAVAAAERSEGATPRERLRGGSTGGRKTNTLAEGSSGINQFEFRDNDLGGALRVAPLETYATKRDRWRPTIVVVAAIVAVTGAASLLLRNGELRPMLLKPNDTLLLGAIQNKTSDTALDGAVLEGLTLDLQQSHYVKILGTAAGQAGHRLVEADAGETTSRTSEQAVAQRVGAKAYLYGEIHSDGNGYVLSVDVLNTQSNDKLMTVNETAALREEIPRAIDRIAQTLRREVGEGRQAIADSSMPLQYLATANVDALSRYFSGEKALADGRIAEGLTAFQLAAKIDPKFALAQMKLAWMYRSAKAEVAASTAAQIAEDNARNATEPLKLLARFCYEMNQSGDYGRALTTIRQYNEQFPDDVDGLVGLARVLRAQGHNVEALLASQQAYDSDPYNIEAYQEAELTLLNLNRFDAALELETQAGKRGIVLNGNMLAVAYLGDKDDAITNQVELIRRVLREGSSSYVDVSDYGLFMDNTGQMSAGVAVWKLGAADAMNVEGMASAGSALLAQGAFDNALAGNCSDAAKLAEESAKMPSRGAKAIFDGAMADALCGDGSAVDQAIDALQSFPHNSLVAEYYVPDLRAVQQFESKQYHEAFELLTRKESSETDPMTRYLLGLVESAMGRGQQAAEDFHAVLEHRGTAFLNGGIVYPMAQIQLSRVLAANNDPVGSAEAYRQFLVSWRKADRGQGIVSEASVRAVNTGDNASLNSSAQ